MVAMDNYFRSANDYILVGYTKMSLQAWRIEHDAMY